MSRIWAGVDAGKTHHHCVVLDAEGAKLLSRRVANDEPELQSASRPKQPKRPGHPN
ncbi:IS110 family transposase [Streptomyces sp. NBC_01619]|uniref:IS110 family transposase n=1 Tax=Streptomyces sp. NBC_01619 TaxID=2975901 RepID=UPI00225C01DE|nr:transposase [Streptomyces sp. NBC_01619]MCX4516016.1 IS110 family transposase [Streptomyces sp. NBC_01619]